MGLQICEPMPDSFYNGNVHYKMEGFNNNYYYYLIIWDHNYLLFIAAKSYLHLILLIVYINC